MAEELAIAIPEMLQIGLWLIAIRHPLDLATNDNEDQIENEEEDAPAGNVEWEGKEEQRPTDPSWNEGGDSMAVSDDSHQENALCL